MSNELLRIHDENNNCDLVAVANPMGNFHMSTYAEMQDGTQKPVDGWYLFSKMIEKLGQGGGTYKSVTFEAMSSGGGEYNISDYPDLIAAIMNFNSTLYAQERQIVRSFTLVPENAVVFKYADDQYHNTAMRYYLDEHRLAFYTNGENLTIRYEG